MIKVGLYLTCQGFLIKEALNLLRRDVSVVFAPNWEHINKNEPLPKEFDEVDIFIYQPLKMNCPDFLKPEYIIAEKLKAHVTLISVPYIMWMGLYPWATGGMHKPTLSAYPNAWLEGDSAKINTKINTNAWDEGRGPEIIKMAHDSLKILYENEEQCDIKGTAKFIEEHFRDYPLFYTFNHPKDILALFFVNQILDKLGFGKLSFEKKDAFNAVLNPEKLPLAIEVIKALGINYRDNLCYFQDRVPRTVANYVATFSRQPVCTP